MSDEIDRLASIVRKKFGTNSAQRLGSGRAQANAQIKEVIPTGIEVIDFYNIGIGGLPVGRMSEVFGLEACGKTTLGLQALASCQRNGGIACVLDPETAFDEERAIAMGVNMDDLLYLNPENLEMCLESMKLVCNAHSPLNGPLLMVWDSIATTRTKAGIALEAGKFKVGETPRILSETLPEIIKLMNKHRAHLFAINQVREKIGVMFGPTTTTPGGHSVHFACSWRLQFFGGKAIKDKKNEHTGKIVTLVTAKTRFSAPFRKTRVRLDYATGWNNAWSTCEHAKTMKLVNPRKRSGAAKFGPAAHMEALMKLGWAPGIMPQVDQADMDSIEDGDE